MLERVSTFFVDCQSTGASRESSELLEIAWNKWSRVLRVKDGVTPKMLKLIGISAVEVEGGVSAGEVWKKLKQDIDSCPVGERMAVAHFAGFESGFLNKLWREFEGVDFPIPVICTHRMTKLLFPRLPGYGLRAVAGWFGAPLDQGKRASGHVEATMIIWQALLPELQKLGVRTLEDLIAFSQQKAAKASGKKEFLIPREKRLGLPNQPGIYRFLDSRGRVLYVGKATSLRQRVNSYFTGGCRGDHRKLEMLAQAADLVTEVVKTPLEAGLREFDEIRRVVPPYNISFTGEARDPLEYLSLLAGDFSSRDFATDLPMARDVFYGIDDPAVVKEGISLWRQSRELSDDVKLTTRKLLNFGVPLLKAWIVEERQRRIAAKVAADETGEEQVEEEGDETDDEFVWTPEFVASSCFRLIRRATRHYVRLKWLQRLSAAEISYSPAARSRRNDATEPSSSFMLSPSSVGFNERDPRRVKVLLHELRRLEAKGGSWRVETPWTMTVPFWI